MKPRVVAFFLSTLALLSFVVPAQERKGVWWIDKTLGYKFKIPKKWRQVPTQIDEKWITVQFQSNRDYEGHVKDDDSAIHKPLMRVIMFDEEAIRTMVKTEKAGSKKVKTLQMPYRDYQDYVKRNQSKGGFYFSDEQEGMSGRIPVTKYQVKVEKRTRRGRLHLVAWIFKAQGVNYAVEFEFQEHHWNKLKSTGFSTLRSFKFIEKAGEATTEKDLVSASKWSRSEWKELSQKERFEKKKAIEVQRKKKATANLPEGWKVQETKYFLVLSHAGPKYTKRILEAATACRIWLEKRLGKVTDEYVMKGLLRICKDGDEYSAYRSGSADAYSPDDREVVAFENKGRGNAGFGFGTLFVGLYWQFQFDKDAYIYYDLPQWLDYGIAFYFNSALVKNKKMVFKPDIREIEAYHELWRRGDGAVLTARQIMEEDFDEKKHQHVAWQITTFLRFLEGPGKRHKLFKGTDFFLRYMQEAIVASDQWRSTQEYAERHEAETEAEEEEMAEDGRGSAARRAKKRRTAIRKMVNKVLCDWTDKEWKGLDKTYLRYLKKER